jgi:hypothetical protein
MPTDGAGNQREHGNDHVNAGGGAALLANFSASCVAPVVEAQHGKEGKENDLEFEALALMAGVAG